jgi:hypothetical protein
MLAHHPVNEDWTLGGSIDYSRFDFEEPAKLLGIVQDPNVDVVDALAESTAVRIWIERRIVGHAPAMSAFVGAGLGVASLDVGDASGPRADGGRFASQTDAGSEILAFVVGGVRRPFGERWYAEAGLTVEEHFADWEIIDRISGARATVDDYLSWGVYAAVGLRW